MFETTKKYGRQQLERRWCVKECQKNASDQYAMAVKKEGTIIGHLPKKLSQVCSMHGKFPDLLNFLFLFEETGSSNSDPD